MTIDFEAVRQANPLLLVVARYITPLIARGHKHWAICPFHDDHVADNFNIYKCKDGTQRFHCFACEEQGDVIDFVGKIENVTKLEAVRRLSNGTLPELGSYVPKSPPPSEEKFWKPIVPVPEGAPEYNPRQTFNPIAAEMKDYSLSMTRLDAYKGSDGELLFYVLRREWGKKKLRQSSVTAWVRAASASGQPCDLRNHCR